MLVEWQDIVNYRCRKELLPKFTLWLMRSVGRNVSSRPTALLCWFCWNNSACTPFFATTIQLFSQISSSHTLCSCLEIVSTTNSICNFWQSNFQQVCTLAFCNWDDTFTEEWNCGSPNNLCKFTETAPKLTTNTVIGWNLFVSWNNHLVTPFRLQMNVGGFFEHQNKTSNTDRYEGYFLTLVPLKAIWLLWKEFLINERNCRSLIIW